MLNPNLNQIARTLVGNLVQMRAILPGLADNHIIAVAETITEASANVKGTKTKAKPKPKPKPKAATHPARRPVQNKKPTLAAKRIRPVAKKAKRGAQAEQRASASRLVEVISNFIRNQDGKATRASIRNYLKNTNYQYPGKNFTAAVNRALTNVAFMRVKPGVYALRGINAQRRAKAIRRPVTRPVVKEPAKAPAKAPIPTAEMSGSAKTVLDTARGLTQPFLASEVAKKLETRTASIHGAIVELHKSGRIRAAERLSTGTAKWQITETA